MAEYSMDAKVYPVGENIALSMSDMLEYFEKHGAMRVSDLHLKIGTPPAYRIDGELVKLRGPAITEEIAKAFLYPLIGEKGIGLLEKDHHVDCSYRQGKLQYRINVFMENDGICGAIRALGTEIPRPEEVGFPNTVWEDIIKLKQGLVLFTGVTGAGKSTTIASLLEKINETRTDRIITLEDPIEYVFTQKNSMISQREIGRDVTTFTEGLRAMMREDPDIIVVGEMRDAETVSMALTAAETGHLVFSTLHTRDVTGSVTRVLDYFSSEKQVEVRNQLSLGLKYVISQKLVPRKNGVGRVVAMEILNSSYAIANLIRVNKLEQLVSQMQTKTRDLPSEKMITLEKHLVRLVKSGQIELAEAKKWANDPKALADAMTNEPFIDYY